MPSLPDQIASQAESSSTISRRRITHIEHIDVAAGVYNCDCNGFMAFVLGSVAPAHYHLIPKETGQPRLELTRFRRRCWGKREEEIPQCREPINHTRQNTGGDSSSWRGPAAASASRLKFTERTQRPEGVLPSLPIPPRRDRIGSTCTVSVLYNPTTISCTGSPSGYAYPEIDPSLDTDAGGASSDFTKRFRLTGVPICGD
jgi:hypothetical protein